MPYDANRVAGGIYGLLLSDALGVPYEFHAPSELPARELIEFAPPAGFDRAHVGTPSGMWSDDGALTLCCRRHRRPAPRPGCYPFALARRLAGPRYRRSLRPAPHRLAAGIVAVCMHRTLPHI